MTKIILIILFSLSTLIAIEFTMTKDGLFPTSNFNNTQAEGIELNTTSDTNSITTNQSTNNAPIVENVKIIGSAKVGNTLTAEYTFVDQDNDTEGETIIVWSTPTKELQRSVSKTFIIPTGYEGDKIGLWIHPVDIQGLESSITYRASNNYVDIAEADKTTTLTPVTVQPIATTNTYLEPINLPTCDTKNPEVQFIKNNADWAHINDINKRIFCVSPGNYTALKNIIITSSGTAEKKRYIILNNGNDIHPAKLNKTQLANFALEFQKANYWTVDRASAFDTHGVQSFVLNRDSSYNIFNRIFTQNIYQAFWIRHNANYNTIQNSRFDTMTMQGREDDLSNINIVDWTDPFVVLGTKIVNNEFINGKAFRLNRYPEQKQFANFDGTIFDHNTVEYTTALYTDCKGNFTPSGACIAGEATGAATKSGSLDPNNPIIISNNHIWGYRPSDPTFLKLSNKGVGIQSYMGSKYVHIKNNVVFNGTSGIKIADRYEKPYGTEYSEITGNLIYDCGDRQYSNGQTSLQIGQAYYANVQNNTIINPIGYSAKVIYNYAGIYVGHNTIINPNNGILASPNNEPIEGLQTNIVNTSTNYDNLSYSSKAQEYTKDYTFITDKFTNNPRTITLKNAIK